MAFVGQNLLLGLFLVFCLAVTLLFSSLFKSSLAAGSISLVIIVAQAGLTALPRFGDYMPGSLLNWGTELLKGSGESYWWALGISIAVIVLCVYFAQRTLQHKDF
jgi:ABC-2 type transport system permease protein